MAADTAPTRDRDPYRHVDITKKLLDCFFDVYHELGLGFLEAVYGNAFAIALTQAGIPFRRELDVPVFFRGIPVGAYKADFLIAHEIIVELKAARAIDPVHIAQLVNYLRGSQVELGYILNFGPKPSFKRFIFSNERKSRCGLLRPSAVPKTLARRSTPDHPE
jgi:GxxExxY protein